ncbi:MAG: hypothetical protein ABIL09_20245 [Gemmatimonadota bacterium]
MLLRDFTTATRELGYPDPVQFMVTTRGTEEAMACAELIRRVVLGPAGGFRDAFEASEITDAMLLVVWGELDRAAKQLGYDSNLELLRDRQGDLFALKQAQSVGEACLRHEIRSESGE